MAAPEAPLLYQGVPRTSAAFRLLQQMGWHEGEGLGRDKQGITEHLRVSKKTDNSGLGVDPQLKAASNWTINTTVFDNILKNLKVIVADADAAVQDQQQSLANAWTANTADLKKATRPQGRYKRRELGKIILGKSQADLEAILGWRGKTSGGAQCGQTLKSHPGRSSSPEVGCASGVSSHKVVEENETMLTRDYSVKVQPVKVAKDIATIKLSDDWWGTKHGFIQGGFLGGSTSHDIKRKKGTKPNIIGDIAVEKVRSACKASFCEKDQEDLCKIIQEKATKARQGLGIASRPKKVGGAYWKGKKVVLDMVADDGPNQDDFETQDDGMLHMDATFNGATYKRKVVPINKLEVDVQEVSKKKRKKDRRIKIKWKSLCEQLLQKAPAQTMSIKHLHKQLAAVSELFSNNDPHHDENVISFKKNLQNSSKFIVEGKKVSLASSKF